MKTIEIRNALKLSSFSHDMIYSTLKNSVNNVNEKISNLVKSGDIIRLKRGFYTFSKLYLDKSIDTMNIANTLYTPSYISFEYALSFHGMIPERVSEITSATSKHNKTFDTPIGRFSYKKIPIEAYHLGIDWIDDNENGGKFIATPEKALCDKIRYDRGIGTLTQKSMVEYLQNDLRLEVQSELNIELINSVATAYRSRNLKTLANVLEKGKIT
ncbi:MAG: hypothetical protein U9R16_04410 [Campylobacterota bacterium]|nr:hypothetical protein [Campylobacterota bacterium]